MAVLISTRSLLRGATTTLATKTVFIRTTLAFLLHMSSGVNTVLEDVLRVRDVYAQAAAAEGKLAPLNEHTNQVLIKLSNSQHKYAEWVNVPGKLCIASRHTGGRV